MNLIVNEEMKKVIKSAEGGRYGYFDYDVESVKKIMLKKLPDEMKWTDAATLVQALYPDKLICSGLFDPFLVFDIKKGKRSDPPKIYFASLDDVKPDFHKDCLIVRMVELAKENGITEFHESWLKYYERLSRRDGEQKC